ncbi:MAG TPA: substrate-binding domain-containing protein [Gaiellaceae bacterium]|nr:substrate-binding domain-containing protein [Gaiellaceae bacterium]
MANWHRTRLLTASVATAVAILATSVGASASSDRAGRSEAGAKTNLPRKTIGVMGPINAAEIIKLGTDATVAAAQALGWKTVQVDPLGDPAKMASGMTSLVNSRVDAIVLTTIEPAVIRSGLLAARRARIPVINTHTSVHSSPLHTAEYFLVPRKEFAVLEARMARDLPRGSEIGTINLPQFLNAKIAGDLIKAAARRHGWRIVASHDTDVQNAVADVQRAVGDMIRANPGLDAIWSCCDFGPTGAIPAIRASGKNLKVYSLHGIPSSIAQARTGIAVLEVAEYQKGSIVAIDELAAYFATGDPISRRMPARYAYRQTLVDRSNASKGYPYPTKRMLAPFIAKWKRLYNLPAR